MPRILNRRLEILYDLARQQAECIVTCTVSFDEYELQQQVNHALQYKIKCQLFDASSGCNCGNEHLLTTLYSIKCYHKKQLKKDLRKDEIYGLLTLSNSSIDPKKQKETN